MVLWFRLSPFSPSLLLLFLLLPASEILFRTEANSLVFFCFVEKDDSQALSWSKLLIMMRLYRLKKTKTLKLSNLCVFSLFKCLIIASAAADRSDECKPEQNRMPTLWWYRFLCTCRASTIAICTRWFAGYQLWMTRFYHGGVFFEILFGWVCQFKKQRCIKVPYSFTSSFYCSHDCCSKENLLRTTINVIIGPVCVTF